MSNYYFTFGSDERFPYQNTYLIVQAENHEKAIALFCMVHPNRDPGVGIYNASDSYSQEGWDDYAGRPYANKLPAEIIHMTVETSVSDRLMLARGMMPPSNFHERG